MFVLNKLSESESESERDLSLLCRSLPELNLTLIFAKKMLNLSAISL